jgi:hypothetical protein
MIIWCGKFAFLWCFAPLCRLCAVGPLQFKGSAMGAVTVLLVDKPTAILLCWHHQASADRELGVNTLCEGSA